MKNILFLVILVLVTSCKNNTKETEKSIDYSTETLDATTSIYPENISNVFDAHGGLDAWNSMQSFEFTIQKPNGNEVTTTSLKNRWSLIEMPKHAIGYNGEDVWLHSKDTAAYKGANVKFYYNLMFYFCAMPFVLADDGIIYSDVEPLVFEGKSYPGIKISYEDGVGESSEDEYILYYDSETNKMAWLSYTMTYFSKEKSDTFTYIQYGEWETVQGILLPKHITWYNKENNQPTTKIENGLTFANLKLSKVKPEVKRFEVPEGANIIGKN